MRVLLSAYACEPNIGSEPGIGWFWALEIARLGHEVWVLTRSTNHRAIDAELERTPTPDLNFLYYDLPRWARFWKKGRHGVYPYYLLWQWGAYRLAKSIDPKVKFDMIHHITFGIARMPTFLGNLGIPLIFGPVAGGERAPWPLRSGYGWRGWILDGIRDVVNWLARLDPLMSRTFRQADRIYVTSAQTLALLPKRYREKAAIQLAVGSNSVEVPLAVPKRRRSGPRSRRPYRILFVGRFLYWKGMHFGLSAFANVLERVRDARLTMVGRGPAERRWRRLCDALRIQTSVDWIPWIAHEEVEHLYTRHDVFLFPSLHDSGGSVVLEAMMQGLPVICLDLGGPGAMVDASCGRVLPVHGASGGDIVLGLADALTELAEDERLLARLSKGALVRARKCTWHHRVIVVYQEIGSRSQDSARIGTAADAFGEPSNRGLTGAEPSRYGT